jgi:hypothetical protein
MAHSGKCSHNVQAEKDHHIIMFSRKTVSELVKALHFRTHEEVESFSLLFGLEEVISGQSIKEKATSIVRHLVSNPDAVGPSGSKLEIEIIEHLIENHPGEKFPELANCLDRDGFEITENRLRHKLPAELPLIQKEDQLVRLLEKNGFNVAKGHYDQAVAAHARGEWASANAQLRTLVEEFFNQVHSILCSGSETTSNEKRIALAKAGFFISEYNEFLFNGTGFVEGFWKRLHPQGSHPGLSESDDSTFRFHLVILVLHYFLTRLDQQNQSASS